MLLHNFKYPHSLRRTDFISFRCIQDHDDHDDQDHVFDVVFFTFVDGDDSTFPEICTCEVENLVEEIYLCFLLLEVLNEFLCTLISLQYQ